MGRQFLFPQTSDLRYRWKPLHLFLLKMAGRLAMAVFRATVQLGHQQVLRQQALATEGVLKVHSDTIEDAALTCNAGTANEAAQVCGPDHFLNELLRFYDLKSDAELSRVLDVNRSVISRIRTERRSISAEMLLHIHEVTNITVRELRNMMGDTKEKYFSPRRNLSPRRSKKDHAGEDG